MFRRVSSGVRVSDSMIHFCQEGQVFDRFHQLIENVFSEKLLPCIYVPPGPTRFFQEGRLSLITCKQYSGFS